VILRDTNIRKALVHQRRGERLRQGGFLLNPFRFGGGGGGGGGSGAVFANVQFLGGFEGSNGGTSFTDESSHARTVSATTGAPTTSTTKVQFGTTALRMAGSQILGVGVNTDWSWMHQAGAIWTWEEWCALDSFAADRVLISTSNGSTANHGIYLAINTARGFDFQMYNGSGSSGTSVLINSAIGNGSFPNDTNYHHVAVQWDQTQSSGNLTVFVDGTLAATVNKSGNSPSSSAATATLKLGGFSTSGSFLGYRDEARLTKDQILYTGTFTPSGPFARS
jgi:hypothetical protein